jgi:hypothetical protein
VGYGLKVSFFYAKLYLCILRPNWAALLPDADSLPRSLRVVLDQLDVEKFEHSTRRRPLPREKLASTRKSTLQN